MICKKTTLILVFIESKIKELNFELSSEFRLRQRIIELEHINLDLDNDSKNLDRMLRDVLKENTQLYKELMKCGKNLEKN